MRSLLTAAPGLGCALMMGGMMWLMMRGNKQPEPPSESSASLRDATHDAELADLRSEVERLRAEVRDRTQQSDPAG